MTNENEEVAELSSEELDAEVKIMMGAEVSKDDAAAAEQLLKELEQEEEGVADSQKTVGEQQTLESAENEDAGADDDSGKSDDESSDEDGEDPDEKRVESEQEPTGVELELARANAVIKTLRDSQRLVTAPSAVRQEISQQSATTPEEPDVEKLLEALVSDEMADQLIDNPKVVLAQFAKGVIKIAADLGTHTSLTMLPQVARNIAKREIAVTKAADQFYVNNPKLEGFRDIVGLIAQKVEAENPEKAGDIAWLFTETARVANERLKFVEAKGDENEKSGNGKSEEATDGSTGSVPKPASKTDARQAVSPSFAGGRSQVRRPGKGTIPKDKIRGEVDELLDLG